MRAPRPSELHATGPGCEPVLPAPRVHLLVPQEKVPATEVMLWVLGARKSEIGITELKTRGGGQGHTPLETPGASFHTSSSFRCLLATWFCGLTAPVLSLHLHISSSVRASLSLSLSASAYKDAYK